MVLPEMVTMLGAPSSWMILLELLSSWPFTPALISRKFRKRSWLPSWVAAQALSELLLLPEAFIA